MNYNSRKELLDRLSELTIQSCAAEKEVTSLVLRMRQEVENLGLPTVSASYKALHSLANQLIFALMEGQRVEGAIDVTGGFLEVADEP